MADRRVVSFHDPDKSWQSGLDAVKARWKNLTTGVASVTAGNLVSDTLNKDSQSATTAFANAGAAIGIVVDGAALALETTRAVASGLFTPFNRLVKGTGIMAGDIVKSIFDRNYEIPEYDFWSILY